MAPASDARLTDRWPIPQGVVSTDTQVTILDVLKPRKTKPASRYLVRVTDTTSPYFGFAGWLDAELLETSNG